MQEYAKAIAAVVGGLSGLGAAWGFDFSPEQASAVTALGAGIFTLFAPRNRYTDKAEGRPGR